LRLCRNQTRLAQPKPRRAGDTIGVLLNRAAETISFFKDGVDLGVAFDHVQEERLYPCVGMRTKDEEVRQPWPWQASVLLCHRMPSLTA